MNILMADDDEGDILLARAGIRGMDVELDSVLSGRALLERLAHGARPDLVLLDINMPGLSGHETLAAMQTDPDTRDIPVVMLTTSDADADIAMSHADGAFGYIHKPLDKENLERVLQAVAERAAPEGTLG